MANIVVVPTDFSRQSIVALEQAASFSKVYNAEIHLVHVLDTGVFHFPFLSQTIRQDMDNQRQEKLNELASDIGAKFGVKIITKNLEGKIYSAIEEYAQKVAAQFIIMGTSGTESIKKKILGSNALKVVRDTKVPVITIKGENHRAGCKKIVLPLDLTKETKEKVAKAIEIAQIFDSVIDVISVKETSDKGMLNKLQLQMKQVISYIKSFNIRVQGILLDKKGNIAETVVDYCEANEADLVIIMTQQEQNITDYFIGSSAQEIIATCNIPVLSIVPLPKTTIFEI